MTGDSPSLDQLERERDGLQQDYAQAKDAADMRRISDRLHEVNSRMQEIAGPVPDSSTCVSITGQRRRSSKRDAIAEFEAMLAKPSPRVEDALRELEPVKAIHPKKPAAEKPSTGKSAIQLLEEMLADSDSLPRSTGIRKAVVQSNPESTPHELPRPPEELVIPVAMVDEDAAILEMESDMAQGDAVTGDSKRGFSALASIPLPWSDAPGLPEPGEPLEDVEDEDSEYHEEHHDPHEVIQEAKHPIAQILAEMRDSVVNLETPPPVTDGGDLKKTPLVLQECVSDKIPKSISENLPKFDSGPAIRTCNRCGHGTDLEHETCSHCGALDMSLGILDYVIAGDLKKVEQILTARPQVALTRTSRHEWTLLHMAASGGNPKMAELLLSRGADADACNRQGKTALHYAAGKGHEEVVRVLINGGANPDIEYNSKSALDLARRAGHGAVVDLLQHVS